MWDTHPKDFGIPIANEMVLEHTTTPTLQVQAPEFQSTTTDTTTLPFHEPAEGISNLAVGTMPLATIPLECEKHEVVPLDLPVEQMSMQGGTSIEDVVVVEDASDDEETTSDVGTAIEDPMSSSLMRMIAPSLQLRSRWKCPYWCITFQWTQRP